MKKLILLSFFYLIFFNFPASAQFVAPQNPYTIDVKEDPHGAIRVQVHSIHPYGVYLVGDSVRVTQEDGLMVKHLRARFSVDKAHEKGGTPSDVYNVLFTRQLIDKVVLSVFTEDTPVINEQVIWVKQQQ